MSELHQLAPGVLTWCSDHPDSGQPNAGVVIDADGVTVIDTLSDPESGRELAAAIDALGLAVRRVVLTSSHIDHVGGSSAFAAASVHGTAQTSDLLDQPPQPDIYRRMFPDIAERFPDDLTTRQVTHVVAEAVQLTPALAVLPLGGQQAQNLVAVVPGADIVFGGALCSFGVVPLGFEMYPAQWKSSLVSLADMGTTFVPGHGPVAGVEALEEQLGYLDCCLAGGPPPPDLAGARWHQVNVERCERLSCDTDDVPPQLLDMLGLSIE